MPRHGSREPRKDTDTPVDVSPSDDCPLCTRTPENMLPQRSVKRQTHYLQIAAIEGLSGLRQHLEKWMHRWYSSDSDRAREIIAATMTWVAGEVTMYSGFVHPETGATMGWYEARKHCHASIQLPHEYEEGKEPAWKTSGAPLRFPASALTTILTEEVAKHAKDPWARGHIILMETGLNRPGRGKEAAAVCRRFAKRWPQDGDPWEREALWWEEEAQGLLSLDRSPGEEG